MLQFWVEREYRSLQPCFLTLRNEVAQSLVLLYYFVVLGGAFEPGECVWVFESVDLLLEGCDDVAEFVVD